MTLSFLKTLDTASGAIGLQLVQSLRDAISNGVIQPGERLPSTRVLASSIGVARGTVVEVFDQLKAEGFLCTRVGSGTRVVADLAAAMPERPTGTAAPEDLAEPPLPASVPWLASLAQSLTPQPPAPFAIAIPEAGIAPDDAWRRLGNRVRASAAAAPSGYADPAGLPALRKAIADHVRRSRAVQCTLENVIVTSGTQQGLQMAARVLLSRGDPVWAEDPAYPGLTAVLSDLDLVTHRVPVDAQGLNVELGANICPEARAAFVTPSHQYPLGMPLSMGRRQALVSWAQEHDAWIVEDDYDSELRYVGHPFPALQGLCPLRVVYLGTFSKVLFPSLRLGYVIAPKPMVEAFIGARAILDRHSPMADQHVLAHYMNEGLLEAHIRRVRGLYAERRATLMATLNAALPPGCSIQPSDQGMHILLWLPRNANDVQIAARAEEFGLVVRPISPMYADGKSRPGLMLGFGGFEIEKLRDAAGTFVGVLKSFLQHDPVSQSK